MAISYGHTVNAVRMEDEALLAAGKRIRRSGAGDDEEYANVTIGMGVDVRSTDVGMSGWVAV